MVKRMWTERMAKATLVLGAGLVVACSGGKNATTGPDKAAYDTAINELKEPVGLIAGYVPHLRNPDKEEPPRFLPKRRPDVLNSAFYAANEIRHAANTGRQQAERSASVISKELAGPLLEVAKGCADPKEPEQIDKCAATIKALDQALEQTAGKAKAAGASAPFPRINPESVTDKAKTRMASFLKAIGPGPGEKDFLAKLSNDATTAEDIFAACEGASAEAKATEDEVTKVGEEIRKVAVHHRLAQESLCNHLGAAAFAQAGLEACRKDKEKRAIKKSGECLSACGRVRKTVDDGVPAAAFSKLGADWDELCKEDDEKK
jgi:hypothetical protein